MSEVSTTGWLLFGCLGSVEQGNSCVYRPVLVSEPSVLDMMHDDDDEPSPRGDGPSL